MFIHARIRYSIFLIILLILLIFSPAVSFSVSVVDDDRIFRENSKAVVVVIAYDEKGNAISQGSGFIVRADGAVVTNYHVISKARDIKVKTGDTVLDVEGLIFTDKENDLVILKAKGKDMPVVKLGDMEKAYRVVEIRGKEEKVMVGGGLLDWEIMLGRKILQIIGYSSPGSSGGPVFNKDGEVIGVATVFKEAQSFNFAIPVDLIKDKISSKKVTSIKEAGLEDYEKTTGYWMALYSFGITYLNSDMHKEAIDAFKQIIRIKPDYSLVHYWLGSSYMELDMHKDAIEAYKQAIRIDPDYQAAHSDLGEIYKKLDMDKEAIETFKQVIRINPDDADAHFDLGFTYLGFGEGYMNQPFQSGPTSVNAGNVYISKDSKVYHHDRNCTNLRTTDNLMEFASSQDAKNAGGIPCNYCDSSVAKVEQSGRGMFKEAIEAFKQAIRINPDYATAHSGLGLAFIGAGMHKEAIEAYKQVIRIKPDDAFAHYYLGLIYDSLNDRGSALEQYKILKKLDSELANKLFNEIYK